MLRVMFYSAGIFRTSSPGGSISNNLRQLLEGGWGAGGWAVGGGVMGEVEGGSQVIEKLYNKGQVV